MPVPQFIMEYHSEVCTIDCFIHHCMHGVSPVHVCKLKINNTGYCSFSSLQTDSTNPVLFSEETAALTAPVPSHLLVKLTSHVIRMKDWDKLKILYLGGGGGGGNASYPLGEGGLATNIEASSVPLGEVLRHFGSRQPLLTSTLLENGASVNAIEGSDVIPLNEAITLEHLPLVETLVQKGANCCVASSDGEPIIHKALRIGLKTGNAT